MKTSLFIFLLLIGNVAWGEKPPQTLDEQLKRDNPKVMAYLQKLSNENIGKRLKGIDLSDGTTVLKKNIFLESLYLTSKKQHIYMFRSPHGECAYVWIDKKGSPLSIPIVHTDDPTEHAYILSGDVYTYTEVHPGDGVVILPRATMKWFKSFKKTGKNP